MRLGLHVSIQGSIDRAVDRGVERGCNTFQMFSRNPRGWHSKKLASEEAESFRIAGRVGFATSGELREACPYCSEA